MLSRKWGEGKFHRVPVGRNGYIVVLSSVLEGKKQARVGRTSLVVVVSYATAYSAWFGIFCSSYIYKIPGLVTKIGASVTACT